MLLKKTVDNIQCYFEIRGQTLIIEQEQIFIDMIKSLNGFKFINKKKPFNELVKEQQQYKKYMLVEFNSKPFDELKFICRAVFNFLMETNQICNFVIDHMKIQIGDNEIIVYGIEQFAMFDEHGYKIGFTEETSFSPSIRSYWSNNPTIIEKIILRP